MNNLISLFQQTSNVFQRFNILKTRILIIYFDKGLIVIAIKVRAFIIIIDYYDCDISYGIKQYFFIDFFTEYFFWTDFFTQVAFSRAFVLYYLAYF